MTLVRQNLIDNLRRKVESAMDYTCSIERATGSDVDADGYPTGTMTWAVIGSDIPCSYFPASEGEKRTDRTEYVMYGPEIHLPLGTDVRLTDRITAILTPVGQAVEAGVPSYNIKAVITKRTHILVRLEAVN